MKRKLFLPLLLCLAILLCACSAEPNLDKGYASPSPDDSLSSAEKPEADGSGVLSDRKLIRRITMNAETEDLDTLLNGLYRQISALGGYVESRDIYNGSAYGGKALRSATLVIRIPAAQLDSFVQQVGEHSNIVSTKENADDVTLQYVDTQSRLKVLRTEEERLLRFLSEAATISEMLEVEKRLTQVQSEIESLTAQLKTYDNLVDYGTVTLRISEVEVFTPATEPGFWQTIGQTFMHSLEGLGELCKGLLIFFLGYSPYFIVLLAIGGCIALLVYLTNRRRMKKQK